MKSRKDGSEHGSGVEPPAVSTGRAPNAGCRGKAREPGKSLAHRHPKGKANLPHSGYFGQEAQLLIAPTTKAEADSTSILFVPYPAFCARLKTPTTA